MSETKIPPRIPQIRRYQNWLREQRGLKFASYHELWRWSVTDLDAYWQSVWDYFDLYSPTPHPLTQPGSRPSSAATRRASIAN